MPMAMPSQRRPLARSAWSTRIASSATKIGTLDCSRPAIEDVIHCSPMAISTSGIASCTTPVTTSARQYRPSPVSAPARWARGSSAAAPRAVRPNATIAGPRSSSATRIIR